MIAHYNNKHGRHAADQKQESEMDMRKAAEIGKKAKDMGLSVRAHGGLVQFVRVVFGKDGKSTVTPVSEYMAYDEAKKWQR